MKESFLHLVWQQQLLNSIELCTVKGEKLKIHKTGFLNKLQGPDFSNALIEIEEQKWAGNIEVHVKSSDWYAHQHQKDKNYNNVILHVVYEHDVEVFDEHSNEIPTLELKDCIVKNILKNYRSLMEVPQQWIFCEHKLKKIDAFKINNWLERVYVERLERKVDDVASVYKKCGKDWEATLFLTLAKYFGGNLNGQLFLGAFAQVDFSVIRKQMVNKTTHSFLYGLLGLLESNKVEDAYYQSLQKEFAYQKQKYRLDDLKKFQLHFYGCRPQNFPTIRLAQLIAFYEEHLAVFDKILSLGNKLNDYKDLFKVKIDDYWQEHYHFDKPSKKSPKQISKGFVDLLLMNVVIPVLFLHAKTQGEDDSFLLELMYEIPPEKNNIISKFNQLGIKTNSALQTQALLTLKKEYCDKERCAECTVGIELMKS
ncbi:hypothetical protein AXE80_02125 [Wenyingzhuangia fucanilytica]|uniref:DUF2851 domain-containing protein n=1 Tax=Wenyingzhuangia fucanilytica TaxID=1790137 RepID=A0A1B1Y306_9FLAO|nr:DUF2851 family protein [Wenyingzhuangia fucanilytica]ANW95154.1 hypothetical protein AXE80_02125 [Wenyingzhuangia fucanilytica]